ncbi:hypothetical protein T492DRAFT_911094, partial [Pavlovales sp. CCMP2436]
MASRGCPAPARAPAALRCVDDAAALLGARAGAVRALRRLRAWALAAHFCAKLLAARARAHTKLALRRWRLAWLGRAVRAERVRASALWSDASGAGRRWRRWRREACACAAFVAVGAALAGAAALRALHGSWAGWKRARRWHRVCGAVATLPLRTACRTLFTRCGEAARVRAIVARARGRGGLLPSRRRGALAAWRLSARDARKLSRSAARLAAALAGGPVEAAFARMRGLATPGVEANRAAARLRLAAGVRALRAHAPRRARGGALAAEAAAAFAYGARRVALVSLAKHAAMQRTVRAVLAHWARAGEARALRALDEAAIAAAQQVLAGSAWLNRALVGSWAAWAVEASAFLTVGGALGFWVTGARGAAFARWASLHARAEAFATTLERSRRVWANASLSRGYRGWAASARQRRGWFEAAQRLKLGDVDRIFDAWRTGWRASRAAGRALVPALGRWQMRAAGAVLRGWAAASAKRAAMRTCVQTFAHGETARRLHLWRDHRRAQHVVKRALAPALGFWQMRATAAAFDGLAAVARARELQVAAIRHMALGALLRGFDKWAAGVDALNSARDALRRPLHLWTRRGIGGAYHRWRGWARGAVMQARAVRHMCGGGLLRSFDAWLANIAEAAAADAARTRAARRWTQTAELSVWAHWAAEASAARTQARAGARWQRQALPQQHRALLDLRDATASARERCDWLVRAHAVVAGVRTCGALRAWAVRAWAAAAHARAARALRKPAEAAVLRQWLDVAAHAAAQAAMMNVVKRAWSRRAERAALASWASNTASKARLVASGRRWAAGALGAALNAWADAVTDVRALASACGAATRALDARGELRALRSWVAVARGKATQAAAIRHLMGGALLRGLEKWEDVVAALYAARTLLAASVGSWANRTLSASYRSWMFAAGERALIRRCAQSFAHGETARWLHLWRMFSRAHAAVKRALAPALGRWQMRSTAAAFDGWAASARGKAMQAAAIRHLVGGALLCGFVKWVAGVAALAAARALLDSLLAHWANASLACAYRTWAAVPRGKAMQAAAIRHLVGGALLRGFDKWAAGEAALVAARALLDSPLALWANTSLARALRSWAAVTRGKAMQAAAIHHLVGGAMLRGFAAWVTGIEALYAAREVLGNPMAYRISSSLVRCYRSWAAKAAERALIRLCAQQLAHGETARLLHGWAANAVERSAAVARLRAPTRRWQQRKTAMAFDGWLAVARGKAMQAAAIRHLVGGAMLRGFAKWAAGVVTLAATRALLDSTLAHWANASLACAYRSWTATAAERALIRRCTLGFAHGETARRLHLWRDYRRAVKRALAPALGRRQLRAAAAAFDGWVAMAPGRAMQAAAIRHLVGGALLRGFVKWASVAHSLHVVRAAAARGLVRQLLSSWSDWSTVSLDSLRMRAAVRAWAGGAALRAFGGWHGALAETVDARTVLAGATHRCLLGAEAQAFNRLCSVALQQAVQTFALRHLVHGALMRGLNHWAAGVVTFAATRALLDIPLAHWANASLARAFRSWAGNARGKAMQALALRRLVGGALARALDQWHTRAAMLADAAAYRAAMATAVGAWRIAAPGKALRRWAAEACAAQLRMSAAARWAAGTPGAALARWLRVLDERDAAHQRLAIPLRRWLRRKLVRVFGGWYDGASRRAMQALALRQLIGSALLHGFSNWAAVVAALYAARLARAGPLRHWMHQAFARGVRAWADVALEVARLERALRTAARALASRKLRGSWAAWARESELTAMRFQAMRSWQSLGASRALHTWSHLVDWVRPLAQHALAAWVGGALVRAWLALVADSAERAAIRTCAQNFAHGETARRLHLWRDHRRTQHAVKRALAPALGRWQMRTTAAAFDGWAASAHGRAIQVAAIRHLVDGAMLRGFAKWAAGVTALAALHRAIATPLACWANASLARTYRSWAAVARGKAIQAAAIRHLVGGAVLRGFAKWAAGVAALAALRRAIATPLTNWANHSLSTAYRSWAFASTERALIRRCAQGFAHGETARLLHSWASNAAKRSAAVARLRAPTRRWQQRKTAMAFDGWLAVARGKVMQAAAIRHLVGGAVLRGFAKWAAV